MNPWDFIDNLDFAGAKASVWVKRTILVAMIASPTFGSWMLMQAILREQQAVAPLASAYSASLTNMLAIPALRPAPVTGSPTFSSNIPVQYIDGHPYQLINGMLKAVYGN